MDDPYGVEDLERKYSSYTFRKVALTAVLTVGTLIAGVYALTFTGRDIGFADTFVYLFKHITGTTYQLGTDEWADDYTIWNTYLPRVIIAIVTGAGLAISGVVMQALLSNPLADPYTTGLSDGACLGAVAAIVMGFTFTSTASSMGIVINAFIGGLIPAFIIIFIIRRMNLPPAVLILIGVALSYIFSALETLIMISTDSDTLKNAYLWQIGSFDGTTWSEIPIVFFCSLAASALMLFCSKKLNLLMLGDDSATSLGLDVDQFRTLLMVLVSVTVATLISFSGIIGFVGLVIPHILRMCIGGDNRYLMPASMAAGALFMVVADLISRTIMPEELRVGLIASIIGAPMFLYMILRKKRYGEGF